MNKKMSVLLGDAVQRRVTFLGPFGVGKSTALRAVSDIPVVNTDVLSGEQSADNPEKTHTTVGFDYGEWQFADGMRVGLCGLPGQSRFDAVWDALLPQSSGVVLWLFGNRANAVGEMRQWLEEVSARLPMARLAVAVTRLPEGFPDEALDPFRDCLADWHPLAPVLSADPRKAGDVRQAIAMSLASPLAPLGAA